MNVSLVLVGAEGDVKETPLRKPVSVLGRQDGCEVRIPHPDVSRRHCEIRVEDDEVTLKDLDSSNGSKVNGRKVTETDLEPGDVISLGPIVLVIKIDGKPESINAQNALDTAKRAKKPGAASKPRSAPTPPTAEDDDEDLLGKLSTQDPDSSSVIDFDFSDEDDDLDRQPRL